MLSLFMAVSYREKQKSRKTPRARPGPASSPRRRPALPLLRSHWSSGSPPRIREGPAPITPPQPAANLELRRHWNSSALLPVKPKHIMDHMHRRGQKKGPGIIPKALTPHRGPGSSWKTGSVCGHLHQEKKKNHQCGCSPCGEDMLC